MNTVRHPAAPTEADVALSRSIRAACGRALYAGHWPRGTMIAAVRLTEDIDAAEARGDLDSAVRAAHELSTMAPVRADPADRDLPRAA